MSALPLLVLSDRQRVRVRSSLPLRFQAFEFASNVKVAIQRARPVHNEKYRRRVLSTRLITEPVAR